MKSQKLCCLTVVTALLCASGIASAQDETWDGRFYITPAITYNFIDNALDVDNTSGYHLAFGKPITRHFNLELQVTDWSAEDGSNRADLTGYGLSLMFFPSRYRFPIYGLLGAMQANFDIDTASLSEDEDSILYDAGIGFLQPIAEHGTALRWEYRYRRNDADSGDLDDQVVMLGLQIPLGAKPQPAPPPVEPPPPPKVEPAPPPPKPEPKPPKPAIVLEGVHFDFDSAKLRPEAQTILSNAAVTLKNYTDIRAIAIGHTCNIGTESYNDQLSLARAQSVKDFLVSRGVSEERLLIRGYGESLPVADNSTEEGRKRNRRVEISVITEKLCLPPREGEKTDANGCAVIQ